MPTTKKKRRPARVPPGRDRGRRRLPRCVLASQLCRGAPRWSSCPAAFPSCPAERPGGRVGAFVAVGLFRGCWLIVGSLARAPRLAIRVLCVGIFFPLQRRWPGVVAADHSIGAGPPISMYCRQAARRRRRRMC
ncbi:unnamed protein product [Amoebophrya sp. A120]|nr:unnamed protein product [Amoebophrya sp. A120]|eukprot:GSA120T00007808001.1